MIYFIKSVWNVFFNNLYCDTMIKLDMCWLIIGVAIYSYMCVLAVCSLVLERWRKRPLVVIVYYALCFLASALLCANAQHPLPAMIGGFGIPTVVGVFVFLRKKYRKEDQPIRSIDNSFQEDPNNPLELNDQYANDSFKKSYDMNAAFHSIEENKLQTFFNLRANPIIQFVYALVITEASLRIVQYLLLKVWR